MKRFLFPLTLFSYMVNAQVGINTTTPTNTLEINSQIPNESGLTFTNINNSTPTNGGQPLGVDASGKLITVDIPPVGAVLTQYLNNDLTYNSTTYQDAISLNVPIGTWGIEALVKYNVYFTNDAKFQFSAASGSVMTGTGFIFAPDTGDASSTGIASSTSYASKDLFTQNLTANGRGLTSIDMFGKIEGILTVTAAGIITLKYAKNANIDLIYPEIKLLQGSYIKLTKLN